MWLEIKLDTSDKDKITVGLELSGPNIGQIGRKCPGLHPYFVTDKIAYIHRNCLWRVKESQRNWKCALRIIAEYDLYEINGCVEIDQYIRLRRIGARPRNIHATQIDDKRVA